MNVILYSRYSVYDSLISPTSFGDYIAISDLPCIYLLDYDFTTVLA